MAFPTYTPADIADFSGRPIASYPPVYSATALTQALLLFKLASCLKDLPEDTDHRELAKMGILSMADSIVLSQEYQKVKASPFSSEGIGSYNYSKTAAQVQRGEATGVMWFDLAISTIGVCNLVDNIPMSGGIEVFEFDRPRVAGARPGNVRMLGPKDADLSRSFGYDPA